jgi:hypothetical protein
VTAVWRPSACFPELSPCYVVNRRAVKTLIACHGGPFLVSGHAPRRMVSAPDSSLGPFDSYLGSPHLPLWHVKSAFEPCIRTQGLTPLLCAVVSNSWSWSLQALENSSDLKALAAMHPKRPP